jgi:mutator protein MutT
MTNSGDTVRVLAAVIRRGNRVLLCKRPAHKRHGGLWEFPGGKLEPGESLLDAARRELAEELGISVVSVGEAQFVCHDPGSVFVIEFVEVVVHGNPVAHEHEDVRWITLDEADELAFAPADGAYVQYARASVRARSG